MSHTHKGPLCPNCLRAMKVARTLTEPDDEPAVHVFKCAHCAVSFITKDHLPIAGAVVR